MPAASTTDSNSSFAYAPGDLIASKYRLEALIGEGGMGAVFRARNTSLDMLVAIKLLRAELNRELLAGRLLQEARAAAKLSHPAIVRVFDVGQTALGDPFIVMELLDGETLSRLIDRERVLTPIQAVQLLLPIADALSAAHGKGFVHRDVKPDNVLLVISEDGIAQPKLLDFGIVKSAQADGTSGPSDAGSVVGSPDYMSPEQARGLEKVDARSDLWSFSVVLYEAIAGVTPFTADTYDTLLRSIVQDEPKTLLARGAADHALSYIVARGLNKDPLERYQSLSQMGKALAAWLADQGISEDASGVSLETKWLGRATDPHGTVRASWPPPAPGAQVSGVYNIDRLSIPDAPVLPRTLSIPPSSVPPVTESTREVSPRRRPTALLAIAAVLLALPLTWLALKGLQSRPQPVRATFAASPVALPAPEAPLAPPPAAIASTVAPSRPEPPPSSSAAIPLEAPSRATPATARPAKPNANRRNAGAKPAPAPSSAPKERLSDLLAPMPF